MNTLNLVRRILVASALLVSFSQVTHASAEELSEESKMSVILAQTMEEGANKSSAEIEGVDELEEEAELLLEDFSEEELEILISQLSDKELLDVEEEALLKVSTQSMNEIKDDIINDYYENTNEGMKNKASQIVSELSRDEKIALINNLENKDDLSKEEEFLLESSQSSINEWNFFYAFFGTVIFIFIIAFLGIGLSQ